jgi:diaminopimelate decarboxylase
VVSQGELERALQAGHAPDDIVFSGVGKTEQELRRALDVGIRSINVESFAELELLGAIADAAGKQAAFGIRVNPDVMTDTHPYTRTGDAGAKFGVPLEQVESMGRFALASKSLRLESVGMHIGSQILDAESYRQGADRLGELVDLLRGIGVHTLRNVDVGGGLGIRYTSEAPLDPNAFAEAVRPLSVATGLEVAVEPGRFIVANAGLLLTRCLYRKRMGKVYVIVDAAMNDFIRASLYDAVHEIAVVKAPKDLDAPDGLVDVVGPVCESGDFLGLDRDLPGAVPGALLAVLGAGAYGFTMASTYNSRPRPPEVLVDGARWSTIRERESLADLTRGERTIEDIDRNEAWLP